MALTFDEISVTDASTFAPVYRATDAQGQAVVVHISTEVIEDYGLEAAQDKASEKHTAGQIEANGSVRVTTSDFQ